MPYTLEEMEPIVAAPEDDPERLQRERDERARAAAAEALRAMQMPEPAAPMASPSRPGQAADVIAQAQGSTWASVPGARVGAGGISFPRQPPAAPPPGGGRMPDDNSEMAPRPGTREHARRTVEFQRGLERDPPMQQPAVVASPGAPMGQRAEARDRPPPMRAPDPRAGIGAPVSEARAPLRSPPPGGARGLGSPTAPQRGGPVQPKPADLLPALDAGLPSDADIRGAGERDTVRSVFGALGNAFAGYSGLPMSRPRREAQELQQRRDAGMSQRMGAKAQDRQQDAAAARQERDDSLARERLEYQRQRGERTDARLDEALAMRGEAAEVNTEFRQERTARERIAAAREQAMRSPGTEEAQRARGAAILAIRTRDRQRAEADRFTDEEIAEIDSELRTLSAAEIDALRDDLLTGGAAARRARAGGGGGRAAREAAAAERTDVLAQAMVEAGTAPDIETARAMVQANARTAVSGLQSASVADRSSRIAGYTRRDDAPRLTPAQANTVRQTEVADREFRGAVQALESSLRGIGPGDRVSARIGAGTEQYFAVQHALEVVRTQLRQISNSGNSVAAQQAAEHHIPGLDEPITQAALLANVRAAQRIKHLYVTSLLRSYGYEPEEGGGGGHGGGRRASAPEGGTPAQAFAIGPDGARRPLTPEQVQRYRSTRLPPGWRIEGGR